MSGMDRLTALADQLDANAANAERMVELLQPEFDAFEARTGHNVYVVRDYVDHKNAAKRQRQEAADIRELLAHRRASQAAPAPSDGLREAVDAAWNDAIEAAGNLESIHGYSNAVPRHRIRALRRAAPTEGEAQSLDGTTRAVLDRAERIVAGQSQQEQRTAEIFLRPTEGEA